MSGVTRFSFDNPRARIEFVIILLALFFIFVVSPLMRRNGELGSRIGAQRSELHRSRIILASEQRIEQEYRAVFSSPAAEPANNPAVNAIKALEQIARERDLKIMDIKQKSSAPGRVEVTLFELTLEGRKEGFVRFIYDLAMQTLLFDVRHCDFKARENSDLLEARFSIQYSFFQ